jgi:SpoVK/Ycf46/Vps4 family AAA+-type ATPase
MMNDDMELINALTETLKNSPTNIPLRKHLAELLFKAGRYEEAERELRQILGQLPDDVEVKIALAETFYHLNKISMALVILEELMKTEKLPAIVFLLAVKIFLKSGETKQATEAYLKAIALDNSLINKELEKDLEINSQTLLRENERSKGDRVPLPIDEILDGPDFVLERSEIKFVDVGGMEQLKEQIRMKIIFPITHPEIFKAYKKEIGGGILLYGPPGCGKTYFARATAGEVNAYFISVGIHDVLDMYIGQSENNLHDLFQLARGNDPCVLFFDEVDALGAKRSDLRRGGGSQLINQFLSELDGVDSSNKGVLILAATNAPWHLDSAFRRPGRFDRVIFVPPPDQAARVAILQIMLNDKPIKNIAFEKVAQKTEHFSGADLRAVVDQAIEKKLQDALKSGIPAPLTTDDLLKVINNIKPTTKEWFATARNYALYSNQSGIYDDILAYLKV